MPKLAEQSSLSPSRTIVLTPCKLVIKQCIKMLWKEFWHANKTPTNRAILAQHTGRSIHASHMRLIFYKMQLACGHLPSGWVSPKGIPLSVRKPCPSQILLSFQETLMMFVLVKVGAVQRQTVIVSQIANQRTPFVWGCIPKLKCSLVNCK